MSFTVVIPARFGSTRLPGKPLLDIHGKPMIQRVWEQASLSDCDRVVIATDDQRIADVAEAFGAQVCMTGAEHPSGTDRLQQVAADLNMADDDIVVNVQGDEPLIPAVVINQVAHNLQAHDQSLMATLREPITNVGDLLNHNVVKVVTDNDSMALYFSRAAMPWPREAFSTASDAMPPGDHWYRHIGIYAYRAKFLHQFVGWKPSALETVEQLEQLRALHHGVKIHVASSDQDVPGGVDTQEDLQRVRNLVAKVEPRVQ